MDSKGGDKRMNTTIGNENVYISSRGVVLGV